MKHTAADRIGNLLKIDRIPKIQSDKFLRSFHVFAVVSLFRFRLVLISAIVNLTAGEIIVGSAFRNDSSTNIASTGICDRAALNRDRCRK